MPNAAKSPSVITLKRLFAGHNGERVLVTVDQVKSLALSPERGSEEALLNAIRMFSNASIRMSTPGELS